MLDAVKQTNKKHVHRNCVSFYHIFKYFLKIELYYFDFLVKVIMYDNN